VYTDSNISRQLMDAGIQDSKAIKSDARIRALAEVIKQTPGIAWEVICVTPRRYNELYAKFKT